MTGPVKPGCHNDTKKNRRCKVNDYFYGRIQEGKELAWTFACRKLKFVPMHNRHAWTERIVDGIKREIRVIKNGGAWRVQSKRTDQENWVYYDEPELPDLIEFRDLLFRKYQRRRASYEDVLWADKELARRGVTN